MSKQIPLTQGFFATVDDEDFERVNQIGWRVWKSKNGRPYAHGWIKTNGKWMTIKMHRFILNASSENDVDHWDNNGLNNQKHNLRQCDNKDNQHNRSKYRNNTSGYKGVSPINKYHKSFGARIRVDGILKHLGYFNSAEEAARAYDKAAIELHGEFANINFKH